MDRLNVCPCRSIARILWAPTQRPRWRSSRGTREDAEKKNRKNGNLIRKVEFHQFNRENGWTWMKLDEHGSLNSDNLFDQWTSWMYIAEMGVWAVKTCFDQWTCGFISPYFRAVIQFLWLILPAGPFKNAALWLSLFPFHLDTIKPSSAGQTIIDGFL